MASAQQLVRSSLFQSLGKRLLIAALAGILLLSGCARSRHSETVEIPLGSTALQMIFEGLSAAEKLPLAGQTPLIPVAIVPHHLTATVTIAAGIQSLVPHRSPSILLLSPDHFRACPTLLCTAAVNFRSSFGSTEPDEQVLKTLYSSELVQERAEIFRREHGITAVIPFLSQLLPGTQVTPVVVGDRPDWKTHQEELFVLFREALKRGTILLLSSDFSHYLTLREADDADEKTAEILFSRDLDGISSLDNPSQSDCPACLWLAARIAEERNAYNPSVLLHTNSARLLHGETALSTTSHFAIVFYENASLSSADVALGGDVTVTRVGDGNALLPSAEVKEFWAGEGPRVVNLEGPLRERCAAHSNPYIFCNLLSIWEQIKDIATHWSMENNHKLDGGMEAYRETETVLRENGEVALGGEGSSVGPLRVFALTNIMNPVPGAVVNVLQQYKRVTTALRAGSGSELPQIVYVHAGTEYRALSTDEENTYLRSFVDAGADAVIAVHSHIPGDMEIYRGAPIFRGLGNFVFDQRDAPTTSVAKVVRLRPSEDAILFETVTGR